MVAAFLLFTFPFFLLLTGQAPVGKSLSILYKSNDRFTKTIVISDQLQLRALLSRAGVFHCILCYQFSNLFQPPRPLMQFRGYSLEVN